MLPMLPHVIENGIQRVVVYGHLKAAELHRLAHRRGDHRGAQISVMAGAVAALPVVFRPYICSSVDSTL